MENNSEKISNLSKPKVIGSFKIRRWVQVSSAVGFNCNLNGFRPEQQLYGGVLKHGCVPFLNCYSCPGAIMSCPIGAMQANINSVGGFDLNALPYLVAGFLILVGSIVGRAACGWLCPFGFMQDLLNKIPSKKFKGPIQLKYLKYFILVIFVFLLPMFMLDQNDLGAPSFCMYICPAGILEGALPLLAVDPSVKQQLGWLFTWKSAILILVIVGSVFFRRPFCRWVCPLGAFYGPFNKVSLYGLHIDKGKCVSCGACSRVCPVNLDVPNEIESAECLHCTDCVKVCPTKCLDFSMSK